MTTKLYDKLVENLNSYIKTEGQLHDPHKGSFCCLGVACDLSEKGEWDGPFYQVNSNSLQRQTGYEGTHVSDLPPVVQHALNFNDVLGHFKLSDLPLQVRIDIISTLYTIEPDNLQLLETGEVSLAELNDCTENFNLIQKVLEAKPESLFMRQTTFDFIS